MPPLRVLIAGGGIAGPALAFWLAQLGCDITIVERHPDLRDAGQQIDLRGQGVQVMRRMGIEAQVREKSVDEPGVRFVDDAGYARATFEANKSGQGRQSLSSEFEIMRGDLCRILYAQTKDVARYRFGVQIEKLVRNDEAGGARVRLSDGTEDDYDLVVGADGQASPLRRMMSPSAAADGTEDPFHFLGVWVASFSIPREPEDTDYALVYHMSRHRVLFTRGNDPHNLQAYLGTLAPQGDDEGTEALRRALESRDLAAQKQAWIDHFDTPDARWITPRVLDALRNSPVADDLYSYPMGQVRADRWSHNRAVLLGDAAYCPSPMTGLGTTSAMVGAYVLAGEIGRLCCPKNGDSNDMDARPDQVPEALAAYERVMRPLITESQKLPPGVPWIFYPDTTLGIGILHAIMGVVTTLRIDKMMQYFSSDDVSGWELPEYGELRYGV